MGLFSFGKKADSSKPVLTVEEVRQRLLSLNRGTAPTKSSTVHRKMWT